MGLLDILNGMQNNAQGGARGTPPASGGMSPWMTALLGLLAYKAMKGGGLGNVLGGSNATNPGSSSGNAGGGLGDVLGGMLGGTSGRGGGLGGLLGGGAAGGGLGGVLGGLLGSGAAGGLLSGGLRNLVGDMQSNGYGDTAHSWVGTGQNRSIDPNELANAVGVNDIETLSQQTGMPREQLLSELSQHLPEFVNQLTPDGRLPSDQEANERLV
jgi:uncharacterized protein YidB (DUF937 family)